MPDSGKQLEKWHAYIASYMRRQRAGKTPEGGARFEPAVTISRQTGAGAITLADMLARHLNERSGGEDPQWAVFDKNLVAYVLEDHGLPASLEQFMPEDKPNHLKDAVGDMLGTRPQDWELVRHTRDTIYRLAKLGRCIVVGRGANIIARDLPNTIHLRLIASLEERVTRCVGYYDINRDEALQLIKKQDRARRDYLRSYYGADIDDPMNYHMVIDVDRFTTQGLVNATADMITSWGAY